jgi:tetratricopeptide (TPR) repeat protein
MQKQRLEKLLEMEVENSQDTFVLYALGMEYLGLKNGDLASAYFKKCLLVDPNYVPAYYQLGLFYQLRNEEDEALKFLETGLQKLAGSKDQKTINEFRSLIEEINF